PLQHLELAERLCMESRCRTIRRRALQAEFKIQLVNNDLTSAARTAMREMAVAAEGSPEGDQLYARTAELAKLWEEIDSRDGSGTCRRLERQTVGRYFFRDFSRDRARGEGLSKDTVKRVNEHFRVLLEDCLAQQAHRLQPPAYETYTVHWLVT